MFVSESSVNYPRECTGSFLASQVENPETHSAGYSMGFMALS